MWLRSHTPAPRGVRNAGSWRVGRLATLGLTTLLLLASWSGATPDLPALRHQYAEAVQDEAAALRFYTALKTYSGSNATVLAYRAVAEALQARYAWSPLVKLRAVKVADRLFTRAVATEPRNVEVRFLRFTVESSVPRYLGFSQHVADDRAYILAGARHYPRLGLDTHSLILIRDFMLRYGECTREEAQMLREIKP